jgi:RNA 2',3'-cyclic 3'-phosphodiesterase
VVGYAEVWERFVRGRRLEFGGHTDPDWSDGHAHSASFIIPVEAARFRGRLEPLRDALRPFPFVSLHPDHFIHITLLLLGFLAEEPEEEGEVSPAMLREIEDNARRVLSGLPAFTIWLANLNAFPGAAFVEVHDEGMLDSLREALCESCGLKKPSGPPHLTLAYFQAPDGTPAPEEMIFAIARYRDWDVGELAVESVEMTVLDLRLDYPEPEPLAEIPLKAGSAGLQA